jgi:flagellar basal-body rod protein FlgC
MTLDKVQSTLARALYVSTSGMVVQNKRMLIISENLANAGVRNPAPGVMPYRRRVPSFSTFYDKKTKSQLVTMGKIHHDKSPFLKVFAPEDPVADKDGFVYESNVKSILEMSDMREASRSHEGNLKAYERILAMLQNTINLLKNN